MKKPRWNIKIDYAKDPVVGYKLYFKHIHNSNGFAISKAFTSDGKDYKPQSTHACLDYGYLCIDHLKEKPSHLLLYFQNKLHRIYSYFFPYNWRKKKRISIC